MSLNQTLHEVNREVALLIRDKPNASKVRAGLAVAQLFTEIHADEPKIVEPEYSWLLRNGTEWVAWCNTIITDLPDVIDIRGNDGTTTRHKVIELLDHDILRVDPFPAIEPNHHFTWRLVAGEWMAKSNKPIHTIPDIVTIHRNDGHTTRHHVTGRWDSFILRVEQNPISAIGAEWKHEAHRSYTTYEGLRVFVYQMNKTTWSFLVEYKDGYDQGGHYGGRPQAIAAAERHLQTR